MDWKKPLYMAAGCIHSCLYSSSFFFLLPIKDPGSHFLILKLPRKETNHTPHYFCYDIITMEEYISPPRLYSMRDVKASLKTNGYAIVAEVLSALRCKVLRGMVCEQLKEMTCDKVDINAPSTHNSYPDFFPSHGMLLQHYGVSNMRWLWEIRQDPSVAKIFASIWDVEDPHDMLVSTDGCSIGLPPENMKNGKGWDKGNSWMHTDQAPCDSEFQCVQGLIGLTDTNKGDATLCLYEGSHNLHAKFFGTKLLRGKGVPRDKAKKNWYMIDKKDAAEASFFSECKKIRIMCKQGDLVLWDSRTFHQGIQPVKGRAYPNTRFCAYVCYTPRYWATEKNLCKKRKLFEEGRATAHTPHEPVPFAKRPRTYGKELPPVKDIPPFPKEELTKLGLRLAGF